MLTVIYRGVPRTATPEHAFTDGRAVSVGSAGQRTPRNAPGLANVAWNATLTWANPALVTLERQMEVPLYGDNPVEMGVTDQNAPQILNRIRQDAAYRTAFAQAFKGDGAAVSFPHVIKAIAVFLRGLVSADSKFDRYQRGEVKLSAAEMRGKDLFFGDKTGCDHCHGSFNFNDQVTYVNARVVETPFHNTGLYNIDGKGGFPAPNRGLYEITGAPEDMGRFRAPSLRNVAVTAPYMHDGSIKTLREVIDFYAAGGRRIAAGPLAGDGRLSPYRSELVGEMSLTEVEKADLLAFLQTLTDECFLSNPRYSAQGGAVLGSSMARGCKSTPDRRCGGGC
ncbi:MAG: MbnH family di-heme enzyme [Gammaproteobacteria bacterium]